jgi:hypothetical protein
MTTHQTIEAAREMANERASYLRDNITCERCQVKIDGNAAYSQQECYQGHRVTAYYCESCRGLLAQIGIGEYSELQDRAVARSGYEPYTKDDGE